MQVSIDALGTAKRETHLLAALRVHLRNRRLYPAREGWAEYGRRWERGEARRLLRALRVLRPLVRRTALPHRIARYA